MGYFVDGNKEGQGTVIWKTGEKFDGSMKNDMIHGQGTITNAHGQTRQITYNMNAIEEI